jgi:transcriptional regulator with XRE-family HTH domain
MSETLLPDNDQTVTRLSSIACVLEWMRSMPPQGRQRFLATLLECSDEVQHVVVSMLEVLKNPAANRNERQRALMTLADALHLNPDEDGEYGLDLIASEIGAAERHPALAREVEKMNSQEAAFAARLKELMESKRVSQKELADRVGCSQPAISQMLNRNCRPQKKTILKLAEALNVQAHDLWPDIEVAEMLDAVANFQQPDYVMTEAEARALADTSNRNRPKIRVQSLPTRKR